MKEVFKIVRGNEYPIKVFVEKMGYDVSDQLRATAVDTRDITNLQVFAVREGKCEKLDTKLASDGSYVTVTIPAKCCMPYGIWGISLTGTLNGLKINSAEKRVFSLVHWNGKSYVPPKLIDGESSYLINLKFAPGDSDITPGASVAGWIGFAVFDNVSDISLAGLQQVSDLRVTRTLTNETQGARFVAVVEGNTELSFQFAGLDANLDHDNNNGYRYYYTDTLIAGDFEVGIS